MNLVIDTSVIIAVVTNEKHKEQLIGLTKGADLIAPSSPLGSRQCFFGYV